MRNYGLGFLLAILVSSLVGGACTSSVLPHASGGGSSGGSGGSGSCVMTPGGSGQCDVKVDGGLTDLGLVPYSCTGTARPDEGATYVGEVPEGLLCADQGSPDDGGTQDYCCTSYTTPCAYNPVAICDPGNFGYQCLGATRPESFNSAITCGNGVYEGDLIDYCCSGRPPPDGCLQSDAARTADGGACSSRLLGWTCSGDSLPKAEELGVSKSRADIYYLLCPTPTPADNPVYNYYCCFVAALPPPGASCVQDTKVPGCQPGRFGFACYGPDTPQDDYLPMHCPDPGVPGKSAEGYPATLYCCDFQ